MSHPPRLTVISRGTETPAEAAKRSEVAGKAYAAEHVAEFRCSLVASLAYAEAVAAGGDLYPAGAKNIARIEAERLRKTLLTLEGLSR